MKNGSSNTGRFERLKAAAAVHAVATTNKAIPEIKQSGRTGEVDAKKHTAAHCQGVRETHCLMFGKQLLKIDTCMTQYLKYNNTVFIYNDSKSSVQVSLLFSVHSPVQIVHILPTWKL